MKKAEERGFSLVELLVVVTIIGIIASLSIPFLQKAIRATENGNAFATMRTISSSEVGYYQRYGRFGRLTEINNLFSGGLGTPSGNQITRGKFVFVHNNQGATPPEANAAAPTDAELRNGYLIEATRNITGEGQVYTYTLNQAGEIKQLSP